jgi:mannose/fructose/N-acetylgalactosamine-specific phosphotransferase system component IID
MSTRSILLIVLLAVVVAAAGCAALDKFFIPQKEGQPSQMEQIGKTVAPIVDAATGTPIGTLILGALTALQSVYIGARHVQKRKKGKQPVDVQKIIDALTPVIGSVVDSKKVTEILSAATKPA